MDISKQTEDYWEGILNKFRTIADQWAKYHLSMKGRVLIANSLMLSIPRYAMNFIELTSATKQKLEKEYYRLIWDEKKAGIVKDLQACMPKTSGGIGCLDLESVANASVIKAIARASTHPELPWVKIVNDLLIRGAGISTSTEPITYPWLQWLSSTVTLPACGMRVNIRVKSGLSFTLATI